MFRNGLLISTAMTAVTLLLSPAVHAASVRTDMHIASRDPNTRFLCTYGSFLVSAYYWEFNDSEAHAVASQDVAVPIGYGRGQTVSSIRVVEAQAANTEYKVFTAGIYSDAGGVPGNALAVGTGKIGANCQPVKITISPITLKSSQRYWVEERTKTSYYSHCQSASTSQCHSFAGLQWMANPNKKRKAYVRTHWENWSSGTIMSSSTSPWTKQSMGPYLKLK